MSYFITNSPEIPHGCQFSEIEKDTPEEPGESFKDHLYNRVYNERVWCPDYEVGDTSIQYKLNKKGYRAPEFEELDYTKYRIACYGCSYTFGVGVKNEDTWPEQLRISNEIPSDSQIWNMGLPGASNDLITRLIYHSAPIIQPQVIFVQWTIPHRREYVDKKGQIRKILTNHPKFWMDNTNAYRAFMTLANDEWDDYCFEKNVTFTRLLCDLHGVIFISSHMKGFPYTAPARDNVHPSKEDQKTFARIMFDNLVDETVFPDNRDIIKDDNTD